MIRSKEQLQLWHYSGTPLMWTPWGPGEVSCIQWSPSNVDTPGDLVKCPVYSGTPLMWTPWGPGEVSCIQWNPSNVDTLGTW